jgi:hypothetical protein
VVDLAVLEGERAEAVAFLAGGLFPAEVVLGSVPLLVLSERDAEVVVEIAVQGGDPGELPVHPPLVGVDSVERRPRRADHRHVALVEVHHAAVEVVGDHRAPDAAGVPVGAEHEVVDEQLRASVEELREGLGPVVGLERVRLVDSHPWQLAAHARELVAAPGVFLLEPQQLNACRSPLFTRSGLASRHDVRSLLGTWVAGTAQASAVSRSARRRRRSVPNRAT